MGKKGHFGTSHSAYVRCPITKGECLKYNFVSISMESKVKKGIKLAVDNCWCCCENRYAIGVFAFAGSNFFFFCYYYTGNEGNTEPNFQRNVKVSKLLSFAFKTIVLKFQVKIVKKIFLSHAGFGLRIPQFRTSRIAHSVTILFQITDETFWTIHKLQMQFIKLQMHQFHWRKNLI